MKKNELLNELKNFYKAIQNNKDFQFKDVDNWTEYERFPLGRCDSTSELIKKFLKEEFNLDFEYRKSEYSLCCFHIYLINQDYIIDFTASQFNDIKKFPEFLGTTFSEIILLEGEEMKNYHFEKKFISLSDDYGEGFIQSKSYQDFYEQIINEYRKL